MAGKTIAVSILADTKEYAAAMAKAEGDTKDWGNTVDKEARGAKESFDGVGEGADTVASKGAQAAGALTGLGDLVGGPFGTAMMTGGIAMQAAADAGDLLNVAVEGGAKLAAKAGAAMTSFANATGLSTVASKVAAGATKAWAAAQKILNVAFLTSPIGIITVAVLALVVAFVIAYKKSDKFREVVNKAFGAVWKTVKSFVGFFTSVVPKAFGTVINWIKSHWKIVAILIGGPIALAVIMVKDHFDDIKDGISNVIGWIRDIPSKIRTIGSNMASAGKSLMTSLFNGFKQAGGAAGDIARNIINSVIDALNSILPHSLPINVGPIHKTIPLFPYIHAFATGGIVTGPTLGLIGEAGPEAVIPLNKAGGLGNTINVYVTAPVGSSSTDIGREIDKHLKKYWGKTGYRP